MSKTYERIVSEVATLKNENSSESIYLHKYGESLIDKIRSKAFIALVPITEDFVCDVLTEEFKEKKSSLLLYVDLLGDDNAMVRFYEIKVEFLENILYKEERNG